MHFLRANGSQAHAVHFAAMRANVSGLIAACAWLGVSCAVAISSAYQRDTEAAAWLQVVAAKAALRVYQLDSAMPWAERQRLIAEAQAFYEQAYRSQLADARLLPADAARVALARPWSPSR